MVRTINYQDPSRLALAAFLKKFGKEKGAPIWVQVADELIKSRKDRAEVNIEKINELTKENDVVVVPGKVLGYGNIDHPLTVASFKTAKSAKNKIEKAKGKVVSLRELAESNPSGANIKILR